MTCQTSLPENRIRDKNAPASFCSQLFRNLFFSNLNAETINRMIAYVF